LNGRVGEAIHDPDQPIPIHDRIVIGQGDQLRVRSLEADISRAGGAGPLGSEQRRARLSCYLRNTRRVPRGAIDHDDLGRLERAAPDRLKAGP
jgi:hypothetical protein